MNGLSLGYLYMIVLTMALYTAIKSRWALPIDLDSKAEPNPVIVLNAERMLALALGMGIIVAGIIAALPLLEAASRIASATGNTSMLMP